MPQIILGPQQHAPKPDGSVRGKAYKFLEKLAANDALPGLHIEPLATAVDPRVRTGRVDDSWRAVMFKVGGQGEDAIYVYLGVWPHDKANDFAVRARLEVNPVNGIAELLLDDTPATLAANRPAKPEREARPEQSQPIFKRLGLSAEALVEDLGLDEEVAELAFDCVEDEDVTVLAGLVAGWQGVALIDLSAGKSIEAVRENLEIEEQPVTPEEDESLATALRHPAARLEFAFIEDNEELRRAIEDSDFAKWRVFLHPEQRRYAERAYNGPFRLSGGAGTGKTVVLLHRARNLARRNPDARIVLTTFNKTLAEALQRDLKLLDAALPIAEALGEPGVFISGVDAAARAVRQRETVQVANAVEGVLGSRTSHIGRITNRNAWRDAIASDGSALPAELRRPSFLAAEYELVVLPNRITTPEAYAKVRRPGRGVRLNRPARMAVWQVITAYRLNAGIQGAIDFPEGAAIAAELLERSDKPLADHVLIDEGQDLGPAHWQFLRALAAEGQDDLFIAEDSHQRVYGHKIVLGRYGIKIVGRSQRLRLNYRTTAQNLAYAVSVLSGTEFFDLEEQAEDVTDYRSARTGPKPRFFGRASADEVFDEAAEIVDEWAHAYGNDAARETIGILVRTEQAGEELVRALDERGLPVRFVANKSIPAGKPVVMTMHRAKGMEFSKVLLFGADSDSLPAAFALKGATDEDREDALQKEKSLLYVAATRARDELVLVWEGDPSELLPK